MQCDQQLCLHSCCLVGSTIQRGNFLGIFVLHMRKVFPSETLLLSLWQVPSCVYSTPAGIDTYSCLSPAHQGKTEVEKAGLTESWHKWPRFCLSFSFVSAQGEQVLVDISSRPSNYSARVYI